MKTIKSKIYKGLKVILIMIVLLLAFTFIINTSPFDEELNPKAAELLQAEPYPKIEDNAFFAIIGIAASDQKNMNQAGHELIQRYIENIEIEKFNLSREDYQEVLLVTNSVDDFWSVPNNTCYEKPSFECLSLNHDELFSEANRDLFSQPRMQLLMKRYNETLEMKTYQSFTGTNYGIPFLRFSTFTALSQINLINKYKNHSKTEFLIALNEDLKVWKQMLSKSSLLIDKMVALSMIRQRSLFISEFLRLEDINIEDKKLIDHALILLKSEDLDLSKTFEIEIGLMFKIMKYHEKDNSILNDLFYQPNATMNDYLQNYIKEQINWSQLPLQQFIKKRAEKSLNTSDLSRLKFHYFYNFIGKVLNEYTGDAAIDDYIANGFDTNNMLRLVQLQLQIKLSEPENIEAILKKQQNLNPYTNQPYDFDKQNRVLKFKCLNKFKKCEIKI